jgi:hypothetical protein
MWSQAVHRTHLPCSIGGCTFVCGSRPAQELLVAVQLLFLETVQVVHGRDSLRPGGVVAFERAIKLRRCW